VIDRDWRVYADKRVVHFLYFYGLWLLIQSGFKFGQVSGGSFASFAEHLAFALVEPYGTLWFIVFARGDPGVRAGEEARPFVASGRIRR
jgi:uncharacterized membrane protein YcfT